MTRFGTVAALAMALVAGGGTAASAIEVDAGARADVAEAAATAVQLATEARTAIAPIQPGSSRLAGANRFETAVAVSKTFSPGVPVVYVATAWNFPDALSAAAAAAWSGGPLLLTNTDALPQVVADEIKRLAPERIVVAGDTPSVSEAVLGQLAELQRQAGVAPWVDRLGGTDRFATAEQLNQDAFEWSDTAFIATGRGFPDALAASAVAGSMGAPVYLVDGIQDSVRPETLAGLKALEVRTVRIAGNENAVSAAIERQLVAEGFLVRRDAGDDRFATAVALNDAVYGGRTVDAAFIATGFDFADALAGAALAGQVRAPLYLVRYECMPKSTADSLTTLRPAARVVLGGQPSVSEVAARGDLCVTWVKPAAGRITDVFGPRTPFCTPGGCTSAFHRGTDIGTGCRAPVYAVSSGQVTYSGVNGTFGNFVRIKHDGRYQTGYAHLDQILVGNGQSVSTGQQIGWSGTTGASTGCHLHFEVYQDGTRTGTQIDPVPFMRDRGAPLG
jgi:murein DD-endopeptidase MepM/ murein hydrolase activator NlpD